MGSRPSERGIYLGGYGWSRVDAGDGEGAGGPICDSCGSEELVLLQMGLDEYMGLRTPPGPALRLWDERWTLLFCPCDLTRVVLEHSFRLCPVGGVDD